MHWEGLINHIHLLGLLYEILDQKPREPCIACSMYIINGACPVLPHVRAVKRESYGIDGRVLENLHWKPGSSC